MAYDPRRPDSDIQRGLTKMRVVSVISAALLVAVALVLAFSGTTDQPHDEIAQTSVVEEQIQAPLASSSAEERYVEDAASRDAGAVSEGAGSVSPMVPALPGIAGFSVVPTVGMPYGWMGSLAMLLEQEPEDEIWASKTRGQILNQVGELVGAPMQMEVFCRTTRCGIVLTYSNATAFGDVNLRDVEERLKSTLNLSRCQRLRNDLRDGVVVVNLHLQQRDGQGCSLSL